VTQLWYDADGNPITIGQAELLLCSPNRQIAFAEVGPFTISTVHTVIDLSLGMFGPPMIYETLMASDTETQLCRTPTRAEALAAHEQAVAYAQHVLAQSNERSQES
jgi:hypothetical protein